MSLTSPLIDQAITFIDAWHRAWGVLSAIPYNSHYLGALTPPRQKITFVL